MDSKRNYITKLDFSMNLNDGLNWIQVNLRTKSNCTGVLLNNHNMISSGTESIIEELKNQ